MNRPSRPSLEETFLAVAEETFLAVAEETFLVVAQVLAQRSTCPRAQVGAVIVRNNRIIATGYNGAAAGEAHCTDKGCKIENNHCIRAIHAETNAVAQAARLGIAVGGATLYFWDSQNRLAESCNKCWQVMKAAGIAYVVGIDKIPRTL